MNRRFQSQLARIARSLGEAVGSLEFGEPVAHVYNPLEYAWEPHEQYLHRYGRGRKQVVLLGMNPGPWGMAQTGVPFGEVNLVRDWLRIEASVGRPESEHRKRPIVGFDCSRSEVSGRRVWGWARDRFGTPEAFFSRFFVANYCPLAFLEASGRNRTPDRLPITERKPLLALCDLALAQTIEVLEPQLVVGLGRFATARAKAALVGTGTRIGTILHPSPASPAANRGWAKQAEAQLAALGVKL
jgi:single-strand selective monofunctional uracil DNA glycosylase